MDEALALRIKNELVDEPGAAVRAAFGASPVAERLYHFTDCEGLVSILRNKTLRASLATGLSDDSEVRYAVDLARKFLDDQPACIQHTFRKRVQHFLDPSNTFAGAPIEQYAYVISFCSRTDRSVHWLHYGRQGLGCALGFRVSELKQKPFELVRIVYEPSEQRQIISAIVESTWRSIVAHHLDAPQPGIETTLFDVGAHSTAAHIRVAAPSMKDPAFENEDEWRLITYDIVSEGREPHPDEVPLKAEFRIIAGRIVPQLELPFSTLSITDLVLGASSPMRPDDPALRIFLRATGADPGVPITRSAVPVRP